MLGDSTQLVAPGKRLGVVMPCELTPTFQLLSLHHGLAELHVTSQQSDN